MRVVFESTIDVTRELVAAGASGVGSLTAEVAVLPNPK